MSSHTRKRAHKFFQVWKIWPIQYCNRPPDDDPITSDGQHVGITENPVKLKKKPNFHLFISNFNNFQYNGIKDSKQVPTGFIQKFSRNSKILRRWNRNKKSQKFYEIGEKNFQFKGIRDSERISTEFIQ